MWALTRFFCAQSQNLTRGLGTGERTVLSMSTQVMPRFAGTDTAPDVVARGKCRCSLVRAWLTEDGWLLKPVENRDPWYKVITQTRRYDSVLEARNVDAWENPSPLSVWCPHGVSTPNVAQAVRQQWRPRLSTA